MPYNKPMNTKHTENYSKMYADFRAGRINEAQWREFVSVVFRQHMKENMEIFVRMKNR